MTKTTVKLHSNNDSIPFLISWEHLLIELNLKSFFVCYLNNIEK